MTDDVTRLRLSLCPHCGAMLDAAVHIEEGSRPPEPGDVTMCAVCAGVMVFDAHVVPRAPTPGEMEAAIAEEPELEAIIRHAQEAVHKLNREHPRATQPETRQ